MPRSLWYVLDGRTPRPVANEVEWAHWRSAHPAAGPTATMHVARTVRDGVTVSTVFLGLDHSYSSDSRPILFETMVFTAERSDVDQSFWRWATYDEAEAGHAAVCAWLWDDGPEPVQEPA